MAFLSRRAKKVAVVDLRGVIQDEEQGGGIPGKRESMISFAYNKPQLDEAFGLRRLAAVALIINSPGGSPSQSRLLGDYIRSLADEKGVPVYAFVEDVAASGGYWIAAAADEIYCTESSIIGSIGVVASVMNFHQLATKYGVENVTVTAGKSKMRLNPFQPIKAEDKEWLEAHAAEVHAMFKHWVVERRHRVLNMGHPGLFEGEVWTGNAAKQIGLIDGIGNYLTVMKEKIDSPKFREFSPPSKGGILKMLFSSVAAPPDLPSVAMRTLREMAVPRISFH